MAYSDKNFNSDSLRITGRPISQPLLDKGEPHRLAMQGLAERLLLSDERAKNKSVHVNYYECDVVNAFAAQSQETAVIGISIALFSLISIAVDRLLLVPGTFNSVLEPHLGCALPQCEPFMNSIQGLANERAYDIDYSNKCRDECNEMRRFFIDNTADVARQFILFHEIAHHRLGHVGHLGSLVEAGKSPSTSADALYWHSLETHADRTAAELMTLNLLLRHEVAQREAKGTRNLADDYGQVGARLIQWMFGDLRRAAISHFLALYIVFRLFGFGRALNDVSLVGDHPSPGFRLRVVTIGTVGYLAESGQITTDSMKELLSYAVEMFAECDRAIAIARGIPIDTEAVRAWINFGYSKELLSYFETVYSNIDSLSDQFRPYQWY